MQEIENAKPVGIGREKWVQNVAEKGGRESGREGNKERERESERDRKEVIEKDRGKIGEKREKVSKTGKKQNAKERIERERIKLLACLLLSLSTSACSGGYLPNEIHDAI